MSIFYLSYTDYEGVMNKFLSFLTGERENNIQEMEVFNVLQIASLYSKVQVQDHDSCNL